MVDAGGRRIGGGAFCLIAGPLAVESRGQMLEAARAAVAGGASALRGGAFLSRAEPSAFAGLGGPALEILAEAHELTGLGVVTEVSDPRQLEALMGLLPEVVVGVGARTMQHMELLRELGATDVAVVLERGPGSTIEEWLSAAEYIAAGGNERIILCERGIRTFEAAPTLDLSAVPVVKARSWLPIVVAPAAAAGRRELVLPLARAAVAAGADGLVVEVHPSPGEALCGGARAIPADDFAAFSDEVWRLVRLMGLGPCEPAGAGW